MLAYRYDKAPQTKVFLALKPVLPTCWLDIQSATRLPWTLCFQIELEQDGREHFDFITEDALWHKIAAACHGTNKHYVGVRKLTMKPVALGTMAISEVTDEVTLENPELSILSELASGSEGNLHNRTTNVADAS